MPSGTGAENPNSADGGGDESTEHVRPVATRRDFLIGAGAGAVTVGVAAGGVVALTRGNTQTVPNAVVQTAPVAPAVAVAPAPQVQPAPAQQTQPQAGVAAKGQLPATMRRVTLDIDGVKHDVTVDVRESLWETMTRGLGSASANLGCDRAQCGACTVVVDGRALNSCSELTARLGRRQKILTVAGLSTAPGPEGLHPIQRAFWEDGGFQCGICTRGFIMSTYALLTANPKPTDDEIAEALSGNICRCGEYTKIYTAVQNAAILMAGGQVKLTAPSSVFSPAPAAAAPAAAGTANAVQKDFEFVQPLATIEDFEPMAGPIKEKPGIVEISGSQATVTVKWDPSKLDEAAVRKFLADAGHPVK